MFNTRQIDLGGEWGVQTIAFGNSEDLFLDMDKGIYKNYECQKFDESVFFFADKEDEKLSIRKLKKRILECL